MKITNTTFNFYGLSEWGKIKVYLSVQFKYILWLLRFNRSDPTFFENNAIKNLTVKKWETYFFFLAKYTYACLSASDERKKRKRIIIK